MTNFKYLISPIHKNDDGSVIIPALMVLVLVTIIGVMSIRTSSDDINISTNQQLNERAFYAAESARAYARNVPVLYGSSHVTPRILVGFPSDKANPATTPLPSISSTLSLAEQDQKDINDTITYISSTTFLPKTISGSQESFRGSVEYLGSSLPPRGSGFAVVKFKAHDYRMVCEGHFSGISDTASRIEAGFFRIGF